MGRGVAVGEGVGVGVEAALGVLEREVEGELEGVEEGGRRGKRMTYPPPPSPITPLVGTPGARGDPPSTLL